MRLIFLLIPSILFAVSPALGISIGDIGQIERYYTSKTACTSKCSLSTCARLKNDKTTTTCPTGWSALGTTCARNPTTTYDAEKHRYTTTTYGSCAGTTTTVEQWECTNNCTYLSHKTCCPTSGSLNCTTPMVP